MRLLGEQLREQVLADGGHFELSPMYHSLVLEDALDLVNAATVFADALDAAQAEVIARWREAASRMLWWLAAMTHPDGGIAFFNDAAFGITPTLTEMVEYAGRLGIVMHEAARNGLTHLADSGYIRLESGPAVVICDVGQIGPDYNPGHAHADTLSFEWSLFGQRVIVNAGTSRYGPGPEREAERATSAHSTVTIDGENSSEVWGAFRVARRARPLDLAVSRADEHLQISGAHDGYRRLTGRAVHRRTWELQPGLLRLTDRVEGAFISSVARFHLHPAVVPVPGASTESGILRLPCGREVRWRAAGGRPRIERSFYCPEFGRRVSTQCLTVDFAGASSVHTEFAW
jgi:uncharacterized heparinase superfamily protein